MQGLYNQLDRAHFFQSLEFIQLTQKTQLILLIIDSILSKSLVDSLLKSKPFKRRLITKQDLSNYQETVMMLLMINYPYQFTL